MCRFKHHFYFTLKHYLKHIKVLSWGKHLLNTGAFNIFVSALFCTCAANVEKTNLFSSWKGCCIWCHHFNFQCWTLWHFCLFCFPISWASKKLLRSEPAPQNRGVPGSSKFASLLYSLKPPPLLANDMNQWQENCLPLR